MEGIAHAPNVTMRCKGLMIAAYAILMSCAAAVPSWADGIRDVWQTVPDSIVPAIDKVRRLEMLDLVDYNVRAEVRNRLGGSGKRVW